MTAPNEQPLFIVGTHRYSFRSGEPAEIIGVCEYYPEDNPSQEPRPCYKVRYRDGVEDFIAISDTPHYKLVGASGRDFNLSELRD